MIRASSVVVLLSVLGLPSVAAAQQATVIDRFEPAPAGDGFFGVPEAHVDGRVRATARALFTHAEGLLSTSQGDAIVARQFAMHLLFAVHVWKRVAVEMDLPSVLFQEGSSRSDLGLQGPASSAALGDLRLGLRVAVIDGRGWIPGASLSVALHAPTGDANSFASTGVPRVSGSLQLGTRQKIFAWGLSFGGRFEDTAGGDNLYGGMVFAQAALGVAVGPVRFGPELYFTHALRAPEQPHVNPAGLELLLGVRGDLGPVDLGLAGGLGLTDAVGTAFPRVLATVGAHGDLFPAPRRLPLFRPRHRSLIDGGDGATLTDVGAHTRHVDP